MEWSDEIRSLKVRTNADTPKDAQVAVKLGAQGIVEIGNQLKIILGEGAKQLKKHIDDLK